MTHLTFYVVDLNVWTGVEEETLHIATHSFATGPFDAPPAVQYTGIISDIGMIERSIFEGNATLGSPSMTAGYLEIANAGDLDSWINYGFDGRSLTVYRMLHEQYPARVTLFTGTMLGIDTTNAWTKLKLMIRDRLSELNQPLLTERYAGTTLSAGGGIEGNADLKDQIKPWVVGSVRNITPKLVNPYDLIYQVSKHSVNFILVKVGGQNVSYGGDAGTLEELQDLLIDPSSYVTCLALGIFRMGFSSDAIITADVVESLSTMAQIADKIMTEFGQTIDPDSITSAHTFNVAIGGVYVDSDEQVLSIVSRVLDSAGFALIPDLFGVYRIVAIRDPADLTATQDFDINDVKNGASIKLRSGVGTEGDGIPAYSVVYNYDVNYTPMTNDQLAGILTEAEKIPLMEEKKTTILNADSSVQEAHPLAVQLTKESLFSETADADAEVSRLLELYSVRRDRVDVTLHDEVADDIELGDCVRLTLDRFGYDSGKKFLVLGRRDEFRTRSVILSLWG